MPRAVRTALLLALLASCVRADTIVLKNGRRIAAENVTDDGEHVSYQTPSGEMSLPKSIVERIDRDGFTYSAGARGSFDMPVSAPRVDPVVGYEDIAQHAVHNNAIDFTYIASLETDARSGAAIPVEKVAAAHHAAAQFLIGRGDTSDAITQYRQALIFAPDNVGLLLNLAVLDLKESQFTAALDPLQHARRFTADASPFAATVAKLMGWAYYGANKMEPAIQEWKHAERLHPDPEVEQALKKAERDKSEEESYREGETAHFDVKYYGGAAPDLARSILRVLEDDYRDIESQLNYTPPEQISVILYTGQAFADITRAPGWVGALNDGRIRIPVQGLSDVTPALAHVLKHELTHSFVGQKSHQRAPAWLQEGIAQWMEGRRSTGVAGALVDAVGNGQAPALGALEGSWMGLSGNSAAFAYAWALAVVESIVETGGMTDISRLLDRIATASSVEAALKETLRLDYSDLQQQAVTYLRHTYVN
jgi:tetratricopeptide (TPR) repeat protein